MTFYPGQEIIWYRQNPRYTLTTIKTPATFIEYQGYQSAKIQIGYVTKVVRTDSLEAVNQ